MSEGFVENLRWMSHKYVEEVYQELIRTIEDAEDKIKISRYSKVERVNNIKSGIKNC